MGVKRKEVLGNCPAGQKCSSGTLRRNSIVARLHGPGSLQKLSHMTLTDSGVRGRQRNWKKNLAKREDFSEEMGLELSLGERVRFGETKERAVLVRTQ